MAAAAAAIAVVLGGCGEDEGPAQGARVTVYAAIAACDQARRALDEEGGRAGSVRVRVRCLPTTERAGRLDLAQIGANARRATEDSTTVAYVGEPDVRASLFGEPILEEAGIAQLADQPGASAMQEILDAIRGADGDSGSLREVVRERLES